MATAQSSSDQQEDDELVNLEEERNPSSVLSPVHRRSSRNLVPRQNIPDYDVNTHGAVHTVSAQYVKANITAPVNFGDQTINKNTSVYKQRVGDVGRQEVHHVERQKIAHVETQEIARVERQEIHNVTYVTHSSGDHANNANANSQAVADSERSRCMPTEDLEEASDILQETGRVILCGLPGTGKTTVGHALFRRCREEGFKPYILSKLEDWHAHIGPGRRSFVLIDTILGEVRVNRQQYEEWRKILRNMLELIKTGDCRVVVTLYPHVLHELQQLETDSQSPLLDSSAVVWLMKEDLDTEVKRALLDFHMKQLPLQPSQKQEVVERIVQADTSGPAFLWCCRYLVDHWQAVEDPATVFTSPAEANSVLLKQMCLHETHGDSFAAVLALAMLGKGRFLHRKTGVQSELKNLGFKQHCADHLAEYEDILHGSVLSEKDYGFNNRGGYDAAGLALGRSFRFPTLLAVCDVTFLVQHVHVTDTGRTQKALKILVGSGPFKSLARTNKSVTEDCRSLTKRLFVEITKGNLPEICQHTALQCPGFVLEMAECCTEGNYSPKQLVRVVDTVHKLPLLYWSALNKRHAMTDWCLSMLDLSNIEDLKCFSRSVLLSLCSQASLKGLFSATCVQCSYNVLFLPNPRKAAHTAGGEASSDDKMVEEESKIQKLRYQRDPSLPIPPSLVRVKKKGDGVTMQVMDRGDWYLALRLLADREVNETDRDGNTLLHIAADKGNLEAITLAVKSGASLRKTNNEGLTPYQLAQRRQKKSNKVADSYVVFDLFTAISDGNTVRVKSLLCYGSSVHDMDDKGRTGLIVACEAGQRNIVYLLINLGADLNLRENSRSTPLHKACENGHTETAQYLLQHGAKVNAVSESNDTPLHKACENGHTETARCLLRHGAKVNAVSESNDTPLHKACENGHTKTAECLLQHGAKVNAVSKWFGTPLHRACKNGHITTSQCLLQYGANVNSLSLLWGTPLDVAREKLATLLVQRGAVSKYQVLRA